MHQKKDNDISYWKKRCEMMEARNRQLEKEIIRLKGGRPFLSEDEKDVFALTELKKALVTVDRQIVWELYKEDLDNDIQVMVIKINNILGQGADIQSGPSMCSGKVFSVIKELLKAKDLDRFKILASDLEGFEGRHITDGEAYKELVEILKRNDIDIIAYPDKSKKNNGWSPLKITVLHEGENVL